MSKKIIILSSQLPQQGKDTVGQILIEKYGYNRIAFADRVKEVAVECFGWDGIKDDKGRQLLIDIGTHTARKYNKNIWIDYVAKKIAESKEDKFVITDCRFINEYERIKENPYLTADVNVLSIGIISDIRGDKKYLFDDSQKEFSKIHKDFLVVNNGTLQELKDTIGSIMLFHAGGIYA